MPIKEMPRRRSERGFSLLEMLLVLFLAPIVFLAVYSNFSTGVKLWQRLQVETPEEDQAIFLFKARSDFQNMMRFSSIPFEGSGEEVLFPAGIQDSTAPGLERAIGRVRYFYDGSARGIMREVTDYSELHLEKKGKTDRMLKDVRSLDVSYLVKNPLGTDYVWLEEYRPEKPGDLPMAVKFIYPSEGSGQMTENTFFIPSGGVQK